MRRVDPRFITALESSELDASLGAVKAFYGPVHLTVLNLSEGGAAFSFASSDEVSKEFFVGAQVDLSLEIHKKAYPVTISVRAVVGRRVHVQFVSKAPALEIALKEFFLPKSLGVSLARNEDLSQHPEVQALVEGAEWHEVWVAPNQTGLFVWFGEDDQCLKILLVSRDLAWEWSKGNGARSGHRQAPGASVSSGSESSAVGIDIIWDREMSTSTKFFVQEILCSWLGMSDEACRWVAKVVESNPASDAISQIGSAPLLRRLR